MSHNLPTEAKDRKEIPLCTGLLDYFTAALAAVAQVSKAGNDQHNPGQPLHWSRGKSMDHEDCIIRHLADRGKKDKDGQRHSAKVAWRALALLQEELEREEGAPMPRNARVDEDSAWKHGLGSGTNPPVPPQKRTIGERVRDLFRQDVTYIALLTDAPDEGGQVIGYQRLGHQMRDGDTMNVTWPAVTFDLDGVREHTNKQRPLRVYVAAKFEEKERARFAMAYCRKLGYEITHDWTVDSADGMTGVVLQQYLQRCAENDVEAVRRADVVLLLHSGNCRGAFWESGVAMGLGKPVVVVGGEKALGPPDWAAPVFYAHPGVRHFDSTVEAVQALLPIATVHSRT